MRRGSALGSALHELLHVQLQPCIAFHFDDSADEGRQMPGYIRSYSTHWCRDNMQQDTAEDTGFAQVSVGECTVQVQLVEIGVYTGYAQDLTSNSFKP